MSIITTRMAVVAGVMCAAAGAGAVIGQAPQTLKAGASVYVIQGAKIDTLAGAPIEKGTVVIAERAHQGGRRERAGAGGRGGARGGRPGGLSRPLRFRQRARA